MLSVNDMDRYGKEYAAAFRKHYAPTPTLDTEAFVQGSLEDISDRINATEAELTGVAICLRYHIIREWPDAFTRSMEHHTPEHVQCEVCGGLLAAASDAPYGVTHIASDGETLTMCGSCHERTKTKEA